MFSQASVILSTGGDLHGRGCRGGGVCMVGGMHGREACVAVETSTAADGTHPTGMHSCILLSLRHIDDFI